MTSNKIIEEDLRAIYNSNIDWDRFANKCILISGANGFLPAYMVESLLFANVINPKIDLKVLALVRNIEKAKQRFKDYLDNKNLEFIEQDVCNKIKITQKVDYIIHAASQASPKYYGVDPVGTLSANVIGTMNMLELAKQNQVDSFLYFSSGEVYGQVEDGFNPVKEDYYGYLDPMAVRSCYGESKRMGENMCVSYLHQYKVKAKVVRPFHTYGPGMDLKDGRVYADFVSNILNNKAIELKSDGSARRAFCYLPDAVTGFFTVLLLGKNGEAYNVGNPFAEHSILELANIISKIGDEPVEVIKMPTNDNNFYMKSPLIRNTPNIEKVMELGWKPVVGAKEGFTRTYKSYK
ncbi:NAD-dependent epimerase/dehydratase family protein [Mucilaginibacter sp.]|uniref:NAD-dependent epimerase/dehydratase family protein n=1 Tax=Mucilaginibacter sp. TaxID=1882438 RepID=UPI00262C6C6B|nr:NAD-dependent epimerase/dehydratase family protein [Mucilaginibacter sp.]MDB4926310.1 dTDP-glucose 46-dehydratase [Mucilaginibacter sp.]